MKKQYWLIPLLLVAFIRAEFSVSPAYAAWDPTQVTYDAVRGVYVDRYQIPLDNFIAAGAASNPEMAQKLVAMYHGPRDIPAKRKLVVKFRTDLFSDERHYACASMMVLIPERQSKRRFVLINSEQAINEIVGEDTTRYRVWPHLGLLYVGTAAYEQGYEVVLWDELVQGYAPMESLVKPGDIVGLSLVTTGIERGVTLARKAKELGARYVVAGNDSAIFRANQLLALQGKPIDAVFTSNSLDAIREFFRQVPAVPVDHLEITGVQTSSGAEQLSNMNLPLQNALVTLKLQRNADKKRFEDDAFLVPKFDLFPSSYWESVWSNYRATFGHKFRDPSSVKNACTHFAQGCTRTRGHDVCTYCTIAGVADIRIPQPETIARIAEAYKAFGINAAYNVTDSVYEMAPAVTRALQGMDPWKALIIYGRAQGVATHPEFLDQWLALAPERLVINMGQDSGDERILAGGVVKSSHMGGSRVGENRLATKLIGERGAYLHASFIFGSPGETRETCESTLEHVAWIAGTLGTQFDTCESDVYWLNFGAPASEVFYNYSYAQKLAAMAGKTISQAEWHNNFASRREELIVPPETERAWYRHFTGIDYDEAREFIARADQVMATVPGSIARRGYKPDGLKKNS